jgi:ankyrin repeat protein
MKGYMMEFETVESVLDAVMDGSTEFGNYEQRPTVNSKGFFGNVPLIIVITWGSEKAVELLLEAGADINALCEEGNTPLHHAIQMGEFKIARMLVVRDARQNIRNVEGKRPCDLCWEGEWPNIFGVQSSI